MPRLRFIIHAAALLIVSLACASLAQAASPRVFIASNGSDTGACARTAPCKTFAYAFSQVLAYGEVIFLDTLIQPAITINKSVTILAEPGANVVITSKVANSTAVSITMGNAGVVVLRGLTVTGQGVGANGIKFNGTGTLHVENCVVSGFITHGIFQSGAGKMFIKDTNVRDGQDYGIRMYVNSGEITGSIDHCRVENISGPNGVGVGVGNNARVSINNTVSVGNYLDGFVVGGSGRILISNSTARGSYTAGFFARDGGHMTITHSTAADNTVGFYAFESAVMSIDHSVATENGNGVHSDGSIVRVTNSMIVDGDVGLRVVNNGKIISRGNNTVLGNNTPTTGTITYDTTVQ